MHPPCNEWPSVGVKGVSSRRGEQSRIRELHRLRSVPAGEGARANDEKRRRDRGIDGIKREGRTKFVNAAEIARTAPRREFGTESQSRCERSKERHECFSSCTFDEFSRRARESCVFVALRCLVSLSSSSSGLFREHAGNCARC